MGGTVESSVSPIHGPRELLEAILAHVRDGIVVSTAAGERIYANETAARLTGFQTVEELLRAPAELLCERLRPTGPDGSGGLSEVSSVPFEDAAGATRYVLSFLREVGAERALSGRHRIMSELGRAVASTLEYEDALREIAHAIVPELADWCLVDLVDDDGRLVRVTTAHVDPARAELLEVLQRRWPSAPGDPGPSRVARTGKAELVTEVSDDVLVAIAKDEEHLRILREIGFVSYLCVPIADGARSLGTATFVTAESGRRYAENDLRLAEEFAARAAAALTNAALYREAQRTSALLDSLYDSAPIGLGFWDTELRYVRVNDALARINALPPRDHVGKTFAQVIPQLAHQIEPIARRVLETREPRIALQVTGGTPDDPEAERHWLASYYPVLAADGASLGVGAVIEEVTDRRRAEQRTELQYLVTRVLADAETVAAAVPRVLETLCDQLGWDVAVYWPVEPRGPIVTWAREPARFARFIELTGRASLGPELLPGRIAGSGEAEWLVELDPNRFPRAAVAAAGGLRSGAAFPIVVEGVVTGVLEAFSCARRPEDRELLRSLVGLGGQLGQFIRRKSAEEERVTLLERERRARADAEAAAATLRKLERVSEVALAHGSLHDLLNGLLGRIVEVLDADSATILLLDDEGLLHVRATVGLEGGLERAVPIPVGQGMAGRVAARRAPLLVPDLSAIELVSPVLRERGINSLVAIPLVADDEVIGVVHAGSEAYAHFTDDDARLLELIADRIALAIEQASLAEATRVAQSRLQFLSEASVVLSSSLDLDLTLRRVGQLAVSHFADAAVIDLVDGRRIDRVVIEVAEAGLAGEIRDGLFANPPSPDDLAGSANVIRTGEPEVLIGLDADPGPLRAITKGRPGIQPTVALLRPRSLVYMPLKARGLVLGVLALIRTASNFDQRDVEMVRELAARAAVAVDNANLYRQAERGRDRLGFLAEASELLAVSLDVDETLAELSRLVVGRHADCCAILLAEDEDARLVSLAHADPAREAAVRRALESARSGAGTDAGVGRAIATGEPELRASLDPDALDEAARAAGARSTLVVPLAARGRILGAMSWSWAGTALAYSEEDVGFASDLARRAAVAIENAQLYRAAEERAQASRVLDSVADGVFLVDRQGIVRTWNRAAASSTGLRAADVVDCPAAEAIPGWAAVVGRVPVARESSAAPRAESLPLDLGDRELWLSLHGVAVPDGTVYAFRDLTEERALESMRTEFVSTVSHELRTPLAAIYGAAMTLRRSDVVLDDDQRSRLLDIVSGEADRLARTVNDILWASRLDSGSLHVSIESCDPLALAGDVVEAQRAHLGTGHELVLDAEDDLPAVASDPDKVGRVLINLVDNAVKYSPDGGRIEVRLRQSAGYVRVSIVDPGLGIPLSEQRRIFEKFYRLDPNMTRGVGGTGLGLYICRELVRRMGGRIWVQSEGLGTGSTFHVELPVAGEFTAHLA